MTIRPRITIALAPLLLASCGAQEAPSRPDAPAAQFFEALASHCGQAFAGQLVSRDEADTDFREAAMVMHVRECNQERIALPFHIQQADGAWDRSRTWLITRTDTGLRLKHDHRHQDGEPDPVTMYGGDTAEAGTARRQDFPVDTESIVLFQREGLDASVTNVWTVEVDPAGTEDATFVYQLQRTVAGGAPEDRFFRVEFDLAESVAPPPAPWGAE